MRLHKGVDIGAPAGSWIRAVNDGLVAYSHNGVSGYGNLMLTYTHVTRTREFEGQDDVHHFGSMTLSFFYPLW